MKTFLYLLLATLFFASCQNQEELRSLEKMQNRTIENLEIRNERRMYWFQAQMYQHGERMQPFLYDAESIRDRTKSLCDSFQLIMEDSTIKSGNLDFAMKQLERHIIFMQNIVKNRRYTCYAITEEDISRHKKHFRISFLQIKQEILIQEYYYLGEIMNKTSSSDGGWWWSYIPSTYMEYRDSSYLNLHFSALRDEQYYVTVDTLLKDGKTFETDYFPEPVMIQSRIKLFELDKGQYQIKGRVRRLFNNGKLRDLTYENEFEIK